MDPVVLSTIFAVATLVLTVAGSYFAVGRIIRTTVTEVQNRIELNIKDLSDRMDKKIDKLSDDIVHLREAVSKHEALIDIQGRK